LDFFLKLALFLGSRPALIASSNTVLTPFCVNAEHSLIKKKQKNSGFFKFTHTVTT